MEFQRFKELQQRHFLEVSEGQNVLFVTNVDKDELWNLYLDSFPPGTNEIFRERREFDCSCCRQFIRSFGNVVFIDKEYGLSSIWDFVGDEKFNPVVNTLSEFVKSAAVIRRLTTCMKLKSNMTMIFMTLLPMNTMKKCRKN